MIRAVVFAAAALAAAACTGTAPTEDAVNQTPPQTRAEATAQDSCGASQYSAMIGQNLAAVTFPADAGIRVVQPDSVVTQDFRPDRLNVITDATGIITALECY